MSADILLPEFSNPNNPNSKIFTKIDQSMSYKNNNNNNTETAKKVQQDLERRLGPRKIKSVAQFDLSEIKQVAEIVDELLNNKGINSKHYTMTSAESRVAPAPTVKRQQLYEQPPPPPVQLPRIPSDRRVSTHRNGSIHSDDPLRGIYTLPSTLDHLHHHHPHPEPKNPSSKSKKTPENVSHFSGKIVANLLVVIQIGLILLFAIFIRYEEEHVNAVPKSYIEAQKPTQRPNYDNNFYDPNRNVNYNMDPNMDRERYNNNNNYNGPGPAPGQEAMDRYGPNGGDNGAGGPRYQPVTTMEQGPAQILPNYYYFFQDVHVMIFVGFGFLMTFLRKYGYSAVAYNMLIAAIAIQWSVICRGLFHHSDKGSIQIDITTLINGDFAAAAVLITFGAVLGVTSPLQLVMVCIIEVFLYSLNEFIGAELFKAIDVGGSMFIHTFGAYFGLSMSLVMRKNSQCSSDKEGATATSDLFAMIGTVFLWMFWPSFNGAMAEGDDQHRAVINTVLSLTASCVFTFAVSGLVSPENKFNMVHIQNATLAGGVAVGAVADLMIRPYGALIIGSMAGILSTLGYNYITPFLQNKINLHDTCGVNNLHGMPGIFAGLAGVVMALLASEDDYGISLYKQYPAMAPLHNSSTLHELRKDLTSIEPGDGRTAGQQALYQLLALGVTLAIAIVGGALTGMIMRLPLFGNVPDNYLYDDSKLWEVPEEDEKPAHQGEANQTFEMKPEKEQQ